MTVFLGSTTFNQVGDTLQIASPKGFDTMHGLRMANFTVDVIVLQGITGESESDTRYLMPLTQEFYPIKDVRDYPTMYGMQLGADLPNEAVLIEWSDDPEHDFIGTYPYQLTTGSEVPFTGTAFSALTGTLTAGNSFTFVENLDRSNLTIVNRASSAGTLEVAPTSGDVGTVDVFTLDPGSSVTIDNGGEAIITARGGTVNFTAKGDHS